MRLIAALLVVVAVVAASPPAFGHKIKLFAVVEGDHIEGSVFFSGNVAARDVPIIVAGPDGTIVARATTDGNGRFRLALAGPFDHRLIADTGDGHRAEFVVRAAELPAVAPPPGPLAVPAAPLPQQVPSVPPLNTDEVQHLIELAVSRQVAPLREQLDAFEQRVLWRDVLGGIGYIVGLFGLAAWLLARHRRIHAKVPAE